MSSHVSLQLDPKSQPPMKLNHTLLLIKARIAGQNESQSTFASLFPNVRENRSTRPIPFSLQTSGGRNVHACYVDLNPTLQNSNRSLHTTQGGFSTLLPPDTKSSQSVHEEFSTSFPPAKTIRSMHEGFSTSFPLIKTPRSMHEEFSTLFPPDTKGSYTTNERFSTPGTNVNRRYVRFSRINPSSYASIASPIAGLGSDSSPPEVCIATL